MDGFFRKMLCLQLNFLFMKQFWSSLICCFFAPARMNPQKRLLQVLVLAWFDSRDCEKQKNNGKNEIYIKITIINNDNNNNDNNNHHYHHHHHHHHRTSTIRGKNMIFWCMVRHTCPWAFCTQSIFSWKKKVPQVPPSDHNLPLAFWA